MLATSADGSVLLTMQMLFLLYIYGGQCIVLLHLVQDMCESVEIFT